MNSTTPSYLGKYEVPPCDTPIQVITKNRNSQLELTEHFIRWHIAFNANGKDYEDSLEWKEEYLSWRVTLKRKDIVGVSMMWHGGNSLWMVEVHAYGSTDIKMFFQEHRAGKEMFDRLETYYLETD